MKKTIIAMALSLQASHASAEDSISLWQNLNIGMSKAQVNELYPKGKVSLTPECEAKVKGEYNKGQLVGVVLKFGDLMGAGKQAWDQALECQAIVRASIVSRYGQPNKLGRRVYQGKETGGQMFWLNGSVMIEFYAQDGRPFTVIEYRYISSSTPTSPTAADKL